MNWNNKSLFSLLLLALPVFSMGAGNVNADAGIGSVSKTEVIESSVLQEDRPLLIHLPKNYDVPGNQFPVLYILDAEQEVHFQRSVEVVESLVGRGELPNMIIVGIENTNRLSDMNALSFEFRGETIVGGASKFLEFIEQELVTFIDEKYRASKFRILFGRSASATFSIFTMVSKPATFRAYIASSPSFFVNEELILSRTREFFGSGNSVDRIFFMNLGTEDSAKRVEQTTAYANLLEEIAPSDFKWEMRVMSGEGHVPVTSMEDGLQMIFRNID